MSDPHANVVYMSNTERPTRPFNPDQTVAQIGRGNILAISGGRITVVDPTPDYSSVEAIVLPVGHGYSVRITLNALDLYTVQRIFRRGGKQWVKGQWNDVYADEIGDVAFRASAYHHNYDDMEVSA